MIKFKAYQINKSQVFSACSTSMQKTAAKQSKTVPISILNNLSKKKSLTRKFQTEMPIPREAIKLSTSKWKYGSGKTPDKLKIATWNVNGIRSVMSKKGIDTYLFKYKPDIFCINQTKIDEDMFNKERIQLYGYNSYWNFCKCSSGYSGVAVFSKYRPISMSQDLPEKQYSLQGRVVTLQFQKFILIACYIPSSGQNLQRLNYRVEKYDKAFMKYCNDLRKSSNKIIIIAGDMNVAHKDIDVYRAKSGPTKGRSYDHIPGVTPAERANFTEFLQSGWVDTFRQLNPQLITYTWWNIRINGRDKNIGWRLDYIIIDRAYFKCIKSTQNLTQIQGSDHCPVQSQFDFSKVQIKGLKCQSSKLEDLPRLQQYSSQSELQEDDEIRYKGINENQYNKMIDSQGQFNKISELKQNYKETTNNEQYQEKKEQEVSQPSFNDNVHEQNSKQMSKQNEEQIHKIIAEDQNQGESNQIQQKQVEDNFIDDSMQVCQYSDRSGQSQLATVGNLSIFKKSKKKISKEQDQNSEAQREQNEDQEGQQYQQQHQLESDDLGLD